MGKLLSYREEIIRAMELLARDPRVVVLGQGVRYPCAVGLLDTLECFPESRRIELPIMEDCQMGMCLGLFFEGFIPLSVYSRMDFLILSLGQLCLHLDKWEAMSHGRWQPQVIIRTSIGPKRPLDGGPQHTGDYTQALRLMLPSIDVVRLWAADAILPAYRRALEGPRPTILVEDGEAMRHSV